MKTETLLTVIPLALLIVLAATPNKVAAAEEAQPRPANGDITDAEFDVKEVGTFDLGDQKYRIWASIRNDTAASPRQWQFLLEPLLQPVRKGNTPEASVSGNFVTFELALWSDEAIDRALHSLQATFPSEAKDIVRSNFRPVPIKSIHLTSADIQAIDAGAQLDNAEVPIGGLPKRIPFRIRATSVAKATDIATALPGFMFNYQLSLSARIALRASAKIDAAQTLMAGFRTKLDGVKPTGAGDRYVQRFDFRTYLASQKQEIVEKAVVDKGSLADPEAFFRTVFDAFMNRWDSLASQSLSKLDATAKESTFNKDDLTPDKITDFLNKTFIWDEGEKQFKMNLAADTSANVSIGPISAGGKAAGSYSKDELEKWLRKNDIDAEWKGTKWEVKDIKVRQVNDTAMTNLGSELKFFTQVLPPETKVQSGLISFTTVTSDGVESIGGRVSNLENAVNRTYSTLPIGAILPYYGKLEQLQNTGWVLCNAENEKQYPGLVPNLEDRFLQGVGKNPFGSPGGRADIPGVSAGTPAGSVGVRKNRSDSNGATGWQGEGKECMGASTSFTGSALPTHNHGGENRPPFLTVFFIIRVK